MANNIDYDTITRTIFVTTPPTLVDGEWVVDLDVKIDFYSDAKEDWLLEDRLNKLKFPFRSVGGDELPGSKSLGATYFLDSDWKIKPYEASHVFKINGNLYSEDGTSPFQPTVGDYNIMIINTVSSLVDSTVQQLAEIEYASFDGGVTIDVINGFSGTGKTIDGRIIGTAMAPSDNLADAFEIASDRGLPKFFIIGDLHITSDVPSLKGFTFVGSGKDRTHIVIDPIAEVDNCTYYDAHVSGTLDGDSRLAGCVIDSLIYVKGFIESCIISPGIIILAGEDEAHFLNCWSGQPGTDTPTIDMGGSGQALALRNYNGGIKLTNKDGLESISVDLNSGQIKLTDTITNGDIVLRGVGTLTEDYSNGANVINQLLNTYSIANTLLESNTSGFQDGTVGKSLDDIEIIKQIETGKWEILNNQMIFYKDDNVTEIMRFDLFDKNGNPSEVDVFKRERV